MGQSEFKNKSFETFPALFVILDDGSSLDFVQLLLIIGASRGLKFVYPGSINCM